VLNLKRNPSSLYLEAPLFIESHVDGKMKTAINFGSYEVVDSAMIE
jgi:hypothetical protein